MTIDYTQPYQPPPPPPPPPPTGVQPPARKSSCGTFLAIGCALILAFILVAVAGIVWFVFGMIKASDVYKDAVRRAQSDPQVVAALGTPIEPKWWVTGKLNVESNSGTADITIPVAGPKQSARIEARALLENEKWRFTKLVVRPENGAPIDLMADEPSPAAPMPSSTTRLPYTALPVARF